MIAVLDAGVEELVATGVARRRACVALGRCRASHYRARRPPLHGPPAPRPRPARALSNDETEAIADALNSERFCDRAPAQVWATLLDEGTYLACISTMYRILGARAQVRERRRVARRPAQVKPELVATGPNQVWSWDITKLAGPHKWTWLILRVRLPGRSTSPRSADSSPCRPVVVVLHDQRTSYPLRAHQAAAATLRDHLGASENQQ